MLRLGLFALLLIVLTSDNAHEIERLARWGSVAPSTAWWDGDTLIATTSEGTYTFADLNAPPQFSSEIVLPSAPEYAPMQGVTVQTEDDGLHIRDANGTLAVLPTSGQVIVSPDRRYAAVVRSGLMEGVWEPPVTELWRLDGPELVGTWHPNGNALAVPVFSPDSRRLYFGAYDSEGLYGGDSYMVVIGAEAVNVFRWSFSRTPAFSADGRYMLTNDFEGCSGTCLVDWDTTPPRTITLDPWEVFDEMQFLPGGQFFALEGNGQVQIWQITDALADGAPSLSLDDTRLGAISPDGIQVVMHSEESGQVWRWDGRAWADVGTLEGTASRTLDSGHWILVTRGDQLQLVDPERLTLHYSFPPRVHPTFRADGRYAAFWDDVTLFLLDMDAAETNPLLTLDGSLGMIVGVDPLGIGVFVGTDSALHAYDLETGDHRYRVEDIGQVRFANGMLVVIGEPDRQTSLAALRVWDVAVDPPVLRLATTSVHGRMAVSGHLLLTLQPDQIVIWDLDSGAQVAAIDAAVTSMILSPDASLIAGTDGMQVFIWEVESLSEGQVRAVAPLTVGDGFYRVTDYGFMNDGTLFTTLAGGADGGWYYELIIWRADQNQWQYVESIPNTGLVRTAPQGDVLVAFRDVYDEASQNQQRIPVLLANSGDVLVELPHTSVTFNADGTLLLSGSSLYSVAALQAGDTAPLAVLDDNDLVAAAFSADSTRLYTWGRRSISVWGVRED